jgi:uncharacterized protein YjbI with pentapeptide repeats
MTKNTVNKFQEYPMRQILSDVQVESIDLTLREVKSSQSTAVQYGKKSHSAEKTEAQTALNWKKMTLSLLVRKLRSTNHCIAIRAVDELRARGRISDDTLSWVCLKYANLQGANLCASNLMNADLSKSNLEMADLSYANLKGARLTRARLQMSNLENALICCSNLIGANLQGAYNISDNQLSRAYRMRACILGDGSLYDGRFNLLGDFADANILHVDLNNPEEIAAFYGVSSEDFLRGQHWRQANIPSASSWSKSPAYQNAEIRMFW